MKNMSTHSNMFEDFSDLTGGYNILHYSICRLRDNKCCGQLQAIRSYIEKQLKNNKKIAQISENRDS